MAAVGAAPAVMSWSPPALPGSHALQPAGVVAAPRSYIPPATYAPQPSTMSYTAAPQAAASVQQPALSPQPCEKFNPPAPGTVIGEGMKYLGTTICMPSQP